MTIASFSSGRSPEPGASPAAAGPRGDQPLLLRAEEAARLLGLGRSKVFAMMAAGELPGVVRIGRSVRVSREALERWVRDRSAAADEPERAA